VEDHFFHVKFQTGDALIEVVLRQKKQEDISWSFVDNIVHIFLFFTLFKSITS